MLVNDIQMLAVKQVKDTQQPIWGQTVSCDIFLMYVNLTVNILVPARSDHTHIND